MSFNTGDVLAGKYRIVKMIGRGGVGEVYEGENLRIHRKVAIKTLRREFLEKLDIVQRFEREAQAAGRIGSAHIVEVLDLGDLPDGSRYLVMEFLEGRTLSKHIKATGRLDAIETAQILVQLLEGLGAAHAAGIIHRDLKPANIVLLPKGGEHFVKILDFGVSKFNTLASDELTMTKTGVVVGTPHYMSPEQAKGDRNVDGRADLYSVGVIAYEAVTGQVPFSAQTFNELLFKIVLEAPPPLESFVADLDPYFASLVRKAMAREPNQRFQTAGELQQALSEWLVQATGGKLGTTLAQTMAFQPAAATMILDPGAAQAATAQVAAAVLQRQAAAHAASGSPGGRPPGPPPLPTVPFPAHPPQPGQPLPSGMHAGPDADGAVAASAGRGPGLGLALGGGAIALIAAGVVLAVTTGLGRNPKAEVPSARSVEPATTAAASPPPDSPTGVAAKPEPTPPPSDSRAAEIIAIPATSAVEPTPPPPAGPARPPPGPRPATAAKPTPTSSPASPPPAAPTGKPGGRAISGDL